jgi:hypothetical protein
LSTYCCFIEPRPAFADEPAAAPQAIQIRANLALEINASDNIRRSAIDPQSDVVFVPQASLLVTGEDSRLNVFAAAHLQYDHFLDQSALDRLIQAGLLFRQGEPPPPRAYRWQSVRRRPPSPARRRDSRQPSSRRE